MKGYYVGKEIFETLLIPYAFARPKSLSFTVLRLSDMRSASNASTCSTLEHEVIRAQSPVIWQLATVVYADDHLRDSVIWSARVHGLLTRSESFF